MHSLQRMIVHIVMMFVRLFICLSIWDGHALWSYGAH